MFTCAQVKFRRKIPRRMRAVQGKKNRYQATLLRLESPNRPNKAVPNSHTAAGSGTTPPG